MALFDIFKGKNKQAEPEQQETVRNAHVPSEMAKKIMELVKCPCEVFAASDVKSDFMDMYIDEYNNGAYHKFFPVWIIVSDTLLDMLEDIAEDDFDDTTKIDGKKFLADRLSDYMAAYDYEIDDSMFVNMDGGKAHEEFICHQMQDADEYILAKVPVSNPWEVIKYIKIGGWNECPAPAEIMAVLEYWYNEHGAVPACVSSEMLELYLPHNVEDEASAILLAKEQLAFCSDIVGQINELPALADSISQSDVWSFWWD